ncbi:MAG: HNH endonuclease signature motif containing protein [Pseudomonadota bacterium]
MSGPFETPNTKLFEDLWGAQKGLCALCGQPMLRNRFHAAHARVWQKRRASFDHIWPRSNGGRDDQDNLQLTHARCNKIKGNRQPAQFVSSGSA